MEYRVTLRSNPRLLILFAIIAAIPIVGVAAILLWSPVAGVIFLAVGAYVDYHLVKFARLQLKSYVRTDDSGIQGLSSIAEKVNIPWGTVTHAGVGTEPNKHQAAFVYDEDEDRLISVPSDYENFDQFVSELEDRFDLLQFELREGETVADRLKEMVSPGTPDTQPNESESSAPE